MISRFIFATLAGLSCTQAALLVYDGYSYNAGTNVSGANPNANTVGLNTNVAYAGAATNSYTSVAGSLSFGSGATTLVTTGNALLFAGGTNALAGSVLLGAGSGNPYVGANVYSGGATSFSGTLYSSYLVNLDTTPTGSTTMQSRVTDSIASSNQRFISAADSRVTTNASSSVSYDLSDATSNVPTLSGVTLSTTPTYMVISRFTGVGTALTAINQSFATMYVLTSAQFDSFMNAGGLETYLDTAIVGTGSGELTARVTDGNNNTSGTPDFADGRFVQYLTISSSGTIDETRYGTTLADVVPVIPEPSSLLLLSATAMFAGTRRKR